MAINEMVLKEKTIVEPETGEKPVIKVEPPQDVYDTNKTIVKGKRILWYVLFFIEVFLFFKFLLGFFGANPWNIFNIIVMIITFPFVLLFSGLFPSTVFGGGDNEIQWSTLFAMFAYLILTILASRFFKLKKPVDPLEAQTKVEGSVI